MLINKKEISSDGMRVDKRERHEEKNLWIMKDALKHVSDVVISNQKSLLQNTNSIGRAKYNDCSCVIWNHFFMIVTVYYFPNIFTIASKKSN